MEIGVCVPYRPVDEEREGNLLRTRRQWDELGWPVFLGDHPGPFSLTHARNDAASQTDADVLVFSDCDILLADPRQAEEAVSVAYHHDVYTIMFSRLRVLDWEATRNVRQGANPATQPVLETAALTWVGCFAISRSLYNQVGGFDKRFCGWGAQDIAFLCAASTLGGNHGKQRVAGDAFHLRHHPMWDDPADNPTGLQDNLLGNRYLAADGNVEAMLSILAER
jgi:hypothetical protein